MKKYLQNLGYNFFKTMDQIYENCGIRIFEGL